MENISELVPPCNYRARFRVEGVGIKNRKIVITRGVVNNPETFTKPCCLHPMAPYVVFGGIRDPYHCDVLLRDGECPKEKYDQK